LRSWCPAESRAKKLSFAVALRDGYTQGDPIGRIEASLKGMGKKGVMNASRYHLFIDMPDGIYTVQVRSDYYFEEQSAQIDTSSHSPEDPVLMVLRPRPCYPFPYGETLIRGIVRDGNGSSVAGAKVGLDLGERRIEAECTEMGEFAIFFGPLNEEETLKDGETGNHYIKGEDGKKVVLQISYDNVTKDLEVDEVVIGETNIIRK